jgi:hypothetical protein
MRRSKGRSSEEDEEWLGGDDGGYRSGGSGGAPFSSGNAVQRVRRAAVTQRANATGRSRPTNNQLL